MLSQTQTFIGEFVPHGTEKTLTPRQQKLDNLLREYKRANNYFLKVKMKVAAANGVAVSDVTDDVLPPKYRRHSQIEWFKKKNHEIRKATMDVLGETFFRDQHFFLISCDSSVMEDKYYRPQMNKIVPRIQNYVKSIFNSKELMDEENEKLWHYIYTQRKITTDELFRQHPGVITMLGYGVRPMEVDR